MKTKYVLGFAFTANSALTRLALIGKTKPRWQAGKLNGVGGKIEPGEEAHDAMQREFREETGVDIEEGMWELFAKLKGEHFEIYCFRVFDDRVVNVRTGHLYRQPRLAHGARPEPSSVRHPGVRRNSLLNSLARDSGFGVYLPHGNAA